MNISMKVLQKAIDKKNYDFVAKKLMETLRDNGWSQDDITILAERMAHNLKGLQRNNQDR